jgi:hypothetical protein
LTISVKALNQMANAQGFIVFAATNDTFVIQARVTKRLISTRVKYNCPAHFGLLREVPRYKTPQMTLQAGNSEEYSEMQMPLGQ